MCLLAACDHTTPFTTDVEAATGPFGSGSPIRVTFDSGADIRPVWLPDGSAFVYTEERTDRADRDRCLAFIPAKGGSIVRRICPGGDLPGDSVDDFESPGFSAGGQLAYVRTTMLAFIGRAGPDASQLVLGTFGDPLNVSVLTQLPYPLASGSVDVASELHWVSPTTLIYLGERQSFPSRCGSCVLRDTLRTGIDVERIDLGGSGPVRSTVPNTASATSVSSDRLDTLFYTLAGDGRVHRRALSTGADTIVADFGSAVTDLSVSGTRLAVVLGSSLEVMDLLTGSTTTYSKVDTNFHRPALSPD